MNPAAKTELDDVSVPRQKSRGPVVVLLGVPLLLLLALYVRGSGPRGADRIGADREARLQPVIRYMEVFVRDHHRLPTKDEFRAGTSNMGTMLVLKVRADTYAASKGAKEETDYLIGTWRVDWYHYYKSWDNSFVNGFDEFPEL